MSNEDWILCSESVPKVCDEVIVCVRKAGTATGKYVTVGWYDGVENWNVCDNWVDGCDVIAWMPLPEPPEEDLEPIVRCMDCEAAVWAPTVACPDKQYLRCNMWGSATWADGFCHFGRKKKLKG